MSFEADLPGFHGPLEDLVRLVVRSEIDICWVPLAELTRQLAAYCREQARENIDQQAEWLDLAARLILWKSRKLLGNVGAARVNCINNVSGLEQFSKRLFGFAALTSMFSAAFDLSQRRRYGGGALMYPSASDTTTAAVGREISQTGAMITRRNFNVQPTVKVPVGYRFTVRVNRDILFEAPYEPLQADPQPLLPGDGGLRRRSSAAVYGR